METNIDIDPTQSTKPKPTVPSYYSPVYLAGHTVSLIKAAPGALSRVFCTVEGTEKIMKIASYSLLMLQVSVGGSANAPVAATLGKRISEGAKFLKIRGFTGVLDYFCQSRFTADTIVGIASMSLLGVACTCEQMMWITSLGLMDFGSIAATIGQAPGLAFVAKLSLASVHWPFALAGVSLAAVAACASMKKGSDNTKHWLKVADNVGKIGLITFSGLAFTYGFAALGLVAASVGIIKIVHKEYQESQRQAVTKQREEALMHQAVDRGLTVVGI